MPKSILRALFSLSIWILFANPVLSQGTIQLLPKNSLIAKAKSMYSEGQFANVALFLADQSFQDRSTYDWRAEEFEYITVLRLSSRLIIGDELAVAESKVFLQRTDQLKFATEMAYHLGHFYFQKSQFDEALLYLEKTNALFLEDLQNERVQFEKGVSYFSQRKFDNARPYFKSLLQLDNSPYKADVQYYLGFVDFTDKKYQESAKWFKEIENHPRYKSVVPFYLAYIAYAQGKNSEAIRYGEKYLEDASGIHYQDMQQLLASIYFNQSQYQKSLQAYEKLLQSGLDLNRSQRFELGANYHFLDKTVQAVQWLKPLSAGTDSISVHSMYLLGYSYLKQKDKPSARSAFQFVVAADTKGEEKENARFLLAKLSLDLGYDDQALQGLSKFITDYPNSIHFKEANELLLTYYAKSNNYRQGLALLEKTAISESSLQRIAPRIYYGRAIELINDGQLNEADLLLIKLGRFRNSIYYSSSLFWRGEIAFRNEHYRESIAFLNEYVKASPKAIDQASLENAWYTLGYAHYEQEEYAKAATYFDRIIQSAKNIDKDFRREATVRSADCYFMQKNIAKAKSLYQSVSASPGYGEDYALFQLAVIEGINSPQVKIDRLKSLEKRFPNTEYAPIICMELANTYMSEEEFESAIPQLRRIRSIVDEQDEMIPESMLKIGIALYNLDRTEEALKQYQQLISQYPSSSQAAEALETSKGLLVELGKINEYEDFLKNSGRSLDTFEKDSLFYQFVQKTNAQGNKDASLKSIQDYLNQFPQGLFVADVLNLKAEQYAATKNWVEAARTYAELASKGTSKYQEKAVRQGARIYFFELKEYKQALDLFIQLSTISTKTDLIAEAQRGAIRCHYYLKDWENGKKMALELLSGASANADDKSFAEMVLAYSDQVTKSYLSSNSYFSSVANRNNASLGSEARYQIASNYFSLSQLDQSESAAMKCIEETGSYEYWVTQSYILLGDIFLAKKDFFNAKATLQSVVENCSIVSLRELAAQKLKIVESEEKVNKK
ncbi:MAG: hypothetical protein RL131_768 [Bacteroidota bacterium]